jgi:hypothetical protein
LNYWVFTSYVHLQDRIPPFIRCPPVHKMVDEALAGLDGAFTTM